jgi:carotenoid cleavage dioxygenase-like enzyme
MLQLKQKYALGFADDLNELSAVSLVVEGTFPNWLSGRLIKNGPAMFHAGERELAHWFDGFAKLHKFDIGSGQIRYSCRFLQSQAYQQARLKGKLVRSEFASNPELSLFERLKAIANPSLTDNTNVNVLPCGQSWLALTETSSIYSFSPESLDTIGLFKFDDNIGAQITTAHPVLDPNTGAILNVHVQISLGNHYLVTSWQKGQAANKRQILTRIPVKQPSYVHSFVQTARYVIIVEVPLRLNVGDLIFGTKPYVDCYEWHKGLGTRFIIVDKADGSSIICESEDRFSFHQVNAFDTENEIVLDMLTYPDAAIVDALRLANLKAGGPVPVSRLERFRIDLKSKKVQANYIGSAGMELPRINHLRANCSAHRYVYGAGSTSASSFLDQIVKLDTESGEQVIFSRTTCYYGEPLFVGHKDGTSEDEGVLLCLELDAVKQCSRLIIIDALSMQLLAEAATPNMVPYGFHAAFTPGG